MLKIYANLQLHWEEMNFWVFSKNNKHGIHIAKNIKITDLDFKLDMKVIIVRKFLVLDIVGRRIKLRQN